MIDLPSPRFVVEQVPAAQRGWVEKVLVGPLNRFLQPLADAVKHIGLGQMNVQVLEYRGLPPSSTAPADFVSTLVGACTGILGPIYCHALEANGAVAQEAVGAMTTPAWAEVVTGRSNASTLRVTSQGGLTPGTRYLIRWIALGP